MGGFQQHGTGFKVQGAADGGAASSLASVVTVPGAGVTLTGGRVTIATSGLTLPNGLIGAPSLDFVGDAGANGDGLYWDTGVSAARLVADGIYQLQWGAGVTVNTPFVAVSTFTSQNARIATPPAAQSLTVVGDTITVGDNDYFAPFTATGALILTSAPTIANGTDGEEILLINVGANTVTIQDQGTLANSNLRLAAAGVAIAPRQSVRLMFSSTIGDWVQVGPLTAVI